MKKKNDEQQDAVIHDDIQLNLLLAITENTVRFYFIRNNKVLSLHISN